MTMEHGSGNIYQSARQTAGLTQERWAEMIGVSADAVRQYETGRIMPSDAVVTRMAEISMLPPLAYWHLRRKSEIAARELPPVDWLPLPQAVVQLLAAMREFDRRHHDDELLRIAADGTIDSEELPRFREILRDLDDVVRCAKQLAYASEGAR